VSVSYHHLIRVQLVSVCPYAVACLLDPEQPGVHNRTVDAASLEQAIIRIECVVVIERAVLQIQEAATDTLIDYVGKDWAVYRMVKVVRQKI